MQKLLLFILFVTVSASISACGIKPKNLEAPNTAQEDQFPRIYPHSPSQSK